MVKKKINKRISKYLIKKKNYLNNSCDNNIKSNEVSCISIRKKLKLKNKSTFKILNQMNNYNFKNDIKNNNSSQIKNIEENYFFKRDNFYVLRCYDCSHIPLIKIKYNELNFISNKEIFEKKEDLVLVDLFCSKGHKISTPLNQYLINCRINHNFISLCGNCHQNKPKELFNFSFCKKCKKTLCSKCSEDHKDNQQNIENSNTILISICHLDFNCLNHKKEFCSFCKECNINLCKDCENNHENIHKTISFDEIKLSDDETNSITFNINLAKKRLLLFDVKILKFIQSLHKLEKLYLQLLDLYNNFISIYKEQIFFAETILSIYKNASENKKYNYQIIQNVRNLKFNIRGIPIKNSYDFTTNIKSLTSYLTNNKNFLLIDIKNYHNSKKILKVRVRAAAKRIRSKIYLNNKTDKNAINTNNNK